MAKKTRKKVTKKTSKKKINGKRLLLFEELLRLL